MKKIAVILLVIALLAALTGCASVGYVYSNASRYTAGDARISDRVDELEINWVDGSVRIEYYNGDTIRLTETAKRDLNRDQQLHWWVDGDKLIVRYAASGTNIAFSLDKELTVQLPKSLELDAAKIAVASSIVEADGLNAGRITIQSASGRIALRQSGEANEIKIDTVSGAAAVAVEDADELHLNTASGEVVVDALRAEEVKLNTVSGRATLQFAEAPDTIDANSVSGNVTLRLPKEEGFTAKVDSLSGRVSGDGVEKGEDRYVYGDEECRINVDTVSANVSLQVQ